MERNYNLSQSIHFISTGPQHVYKVKLLEFVLILTLV